MASSTKNTMEKKICLITGSSRGIGFYTALGLAQKGAHVILVSHNQEHGDRALQAIREKAGKDSSHFYLSDLSNMTDIRTLAQNIKNAYTHLDILINNVGGWFPEYTETDEGLEMTFTLNHLGYFLLTGLLLDLFYVDKHSRIINVSSEAHRSVRKFHFDDIQFQKKYRAFPAYAQSKLANILFTYELSNRLAGCGITVNALHPGLVASELYRHYGEKFSFFKLLADLFGKTSAEGAETSIYLSTSPNVAQLTGKYFNNKQSLKSSKVSYDGQAAKILWEISEDMTGFSYPVLV